MSAQEFIDINFKYTDPNAEWPIFPFISNNRITALRAGLYKKLKASYYGITAKYDLRRGEYIFPLYGFYWIEEDIVIVPNEMELNISKQKLLDAYLAQGYKQVSKLPSLRSKEFPVDSQEAKLALMQKTTFSKD